VGRNAPLAEKALLRQLDQRKRGGVIGGHLAVCRIGRLGEGLLGRRWQQHAIHHVNDAVAGLHVRLHDIGAAHRHAAIIGYLNC